MSKYFNVNGACFPDEHYMVDLSGRLEKIRKFVDDGKYFVINRARQYGKTTTLWALGEYLRADYIVFSLSFQRMSSAVFQDEYTFSREFARMIIRAARNRRRKIRPEEEHRYNSPWNVAADFDVDMSFCPEDIRGMLREYEADYKTGMDCAGIASLIYDYTAGYPFLVSRICKLTDEKIAGSNDFEDKSAAWTKNGVTEAIKILLAESNTLFESLTGKLTDYPDLKKLLYTLLFTGSSIPYNSLNDSLKVAEMFGFVKNQNGNVMISNRIFETILYNLFLSEEALDNVLKTEC